MEPGFEIAVIGAGVVGLAVAAELARAGISVVVLEREPSFGAGISSRNSEVIHSGIYYAPTSLKARLCVAGRDMLYRWAHDRAVPHRRCGKLVVATDETQRASLDAIRALALANDVPDTIMLEGAEAIAMEPALAAVQALWVPSTGIIDSHTFMLSLIAEIEQFGGMVIYRTPIDRITPKSGYFALSVEGETEPAITVRGIVNAGGLDAQQIAGRIEGFPVSTIPPLWLAKGNYYALRGKSPFSRLIYPVPAPGGLGTHLTIDMAGQAKFGPDVEWIETIDYMPNPDRADDFVAAVQAYWPAVTKDMLHPSYSGIRPKLGPPGSPAADFIVSGPTDHGVEGLINLFGIESPGLTSSLAIARHVSAMIS